MAANSGTSSNYCANTPLNFGQGTHLTVLGKSPLYVYLLFWDKTGSFFSCFVPVTSFTSSKYFALEQVGILYWRNSVAALIIAVTYVVLWLVESKGWLVFNKLLFTRMPLWVKVTRHEEKRPFWNHLLNNVMILYNLHKILAFFVHLGRKLELISLSHKLRLWKASQ